MEKNAWLREKGANLRDWWALVTITNFLLILFLLGLHLLMFLAVRFAVQASVETDSDVPDGIALASQLLMLATWFAFRRELRSRPPSKNGQHLERLTRGWPDPQQTSRLTVMSSLLQRPAATWDPANIPYHRLLMFLTVDRKYAVVPFDPRKEFAFAVQMDLAAMRFEPYKTAATMSDQQINKMIFPDRYDDGDPVMIFSISSEQLQIFACLQEKNHQQFRGAPEIEEDSDEEDEKQVH